MNPDKKNKIQHPNQDVWDNLEEQMATDWNEMELTETVDIATRKRILKHIKGQLRHKKKWYIGRAAILTALLLVGFLVRGYWPEERQIFIEGDYTLTDGSIMTVSAGQAYCYGWSEDQPRKVWLEGNASFDVSHLPNRLDSRFIVHVGELLIQVLGTKFSVVTDDTEVQVSLESGIVNLTGLNDQQIKMQAGQTFSYNKSSGGFSEVLPEAKSQIIDFDNQTLREVIKILNAASDTTFIIENDELKNHHFTGSARLDKMGKFYKVLDEIFEIKVSKQNSANVLYKNSH
ncbi:MAG: FecR domain-containing protein [Cyclobacteriaceae bacterium]